MKAFSSFMLDDRERYNDLFRVWKTAGGDRKEFRIAAIKSGYTDDDVTSFIKQNGTSGTGKAVPLKQDQWWDNPTPERSSRMN